VAVTGGERGLKLHLGCGSFVAPGWENIDKSWGVTLARIPGARRALARLRVLTPEQASAVFPAGIVRADVRKGLPYATGAAVAVYSSHMVEHMSRWQALAMLRDCHRVLAPGGVVRLATPDLRALVDEYVRGETRRGATAGDSFMQQLETYRDEPGSVAQQLVRRFLTAPHQWIYDERSLVRLFEEAGFVDVRRRGFHDSDIEGIEALEKREESLFVEGRRP
jgi:predicted SAM-dependent methyltransferase